MHRNPPSAEGLLHLELKLGLARGRRFRQGGHSQWAVDLAREHRGYWSGLIGTVEVAEMDELTRIEKVKLTRGGKLRCITHNQALAAYRTWRVIQSVGHRAAQASMPRATGYLHMQILFAAGFRGRTFPPEHRREFVVWHWSLMSR